MKGGDWLWAVGGLAVVGVLTGGTGSALGALAGKSTLHPGQRERCGWVGVFCHCGRAGEDGGLPPIFPTRNGVLSRTFERAGFERIVSERLGTILRYGSAAEALEAAFAGGPVALAYSRFNHNARGSACGIP